MDRTCDGCGTQLVGMQRRWCSGRCRKRTLYGTPCEHCGSLTTGDGAPHRWCGVCAVPVSSERERARWAPRRKLIEEMWAAGFTTRRICEELGDSYYPSKVSMWRKRGYDLPHRRTPEQVARITAGSSERMAKARAAYRKQRAGQ